MGVCKGGRLYVCMYVRPFVHHHDGWDILLVVDIFKIVTLTLDLGSQLHASPYTCGCHTSSCSEIIIFTALAGRMTPSDKLYPLRTQPQPKEKERESGQTYIQTG